MKALTCEMCGSTNLVKNEGVFVCQSCGTKYSVEEAKKMMIEGTVNVEGTIKIDNSNELQNLYEIARHAKITGNNEQARKSYDKILISDPNSWEANFYTVYYQSMSCNIAGIAHAGNTLTLCLPTVIHLVKKYIPESEQHDVIEEIYDKTINIASMLSEAAISHYNDIDISIRDRFRQDYVNNMASVTFLVYSLGNIIDENWGAKEQFNSVDLWEKGIDYQNKFFRMLQDPSSSIKSMEAYANKIKAYNPEYKLPELNNTSSNGGCYIATSVYGSYNCPEVWTLRRYRDYILVKKWYGRAFVRIYYAISPTFIKLFGETKLFKKICKSKLDKLVNNLQGNGISSKPYNDRNW